MYTTNGASKTKETVKQQQNIIALHSYTEHAERKKKRIF